MEVEGTDAADGYSDYGSDFTPDEERIVAGLLQPGFEADNPNQDPDLQLKDIEDYEGPRGLRIFRQSGSQRSSQGPSVQVSAVSKKMVRIEVDGDRRNAPTKSASFVSQHVQS